MGEPRRIELMTVSAPQNGKKDNKKKKTVRFHLPLTDSTSESCPEYSYAYLMQKHLEKKAAPPVNHPAAAELDPDDPFAAKDAAEHEKLLNLAKSYEAKYGVVKPTKKGKLRIGGLGDMVDLGDGYDETDPFIDNTDAYDEVIPNSLTTQHGGFYINMGSLDFRPVSGDEEEIFRPCIKKRKKKRLITSDSENDGESRKKAIKLKRRITDLDLKYRKKKLGLDGRPLKKKRLISVKGRVGRPPLARTLAASADKMQNGNSSKSDTPSPKVSNMTAEDYDSLFDSVIKKNADDTNDKPPVLKKQAVEKLNSTSDEEKLTPEEAPSLPNSVSGKLLDAVLKIKEAAKSTSSTDNKSKFFTLETNQLLLRIEVLSSMNLSLSERTTLFTHLSAFLPLNKEALMKRAKKLRTNQQDERLKAPIGRLREAVQQAMPLLIEKHQQDLQVTEKAKMDRAQGNKDKDGSTDSDEEGKSAEEKQKRIMAPRKKFEWTSEMRSMLCEVVRIKMDTYESMKTKASAEDYLRNFLDAEIKSLWPPGWMQTRMLFKESRSVHSRWTIEKPKIKKTVFTGATKPSILHPSAAALKAVSQNFAPSSTLPSIPASNGHIAAPESTKPKEAEKKDPSKSPTPKPREEPAQKTSPSAARAPEPASKEASHAREMFQSQFNEFVSALQQDSQRAANMSKSVHKAWLAIGETDSKPPPEKRKTPPPPAVSVLAEPTPEAEWPMFGQSSSQRTEKQQPKIFQSSQVESRPKPLTITSPPYANRAEVKGQGSFGFSTSESNVAPEKPPVVSPIVSRPPAAPLPAAVAPVRRETVKPVAQTAPMPRISNSAESKPPISRNLPPPAHSKPRISLLRPPNPNSAPQQHIPAPQQSMPTNQQQTPAPQQRTPVSQQNIPAPQQNMPATQQRTSAPQQRALTPVQQVQQPHQKQQQQQQRSSASVAPQRPQVSLSAAQSRPVTAISPQQQQRPPANPVSPQVRPTAPQAPSMTSQNTHRVSPQPSHRPSPQHQANRAVSASGVTSRAPTFSSTPAHTPSPRTLSSHSPPQSSTSLAHSRASFPSPQPQTRAPSFASSDSVYSVPRTMHDAAASHLVAKPRPSVARADPSPLNQQQHKAPSVPESPTLLPSKSNKSFGGLTLEQIQAQTLAKTQKTHNYAASARQPPQPSQPSYQHQSHRSPKSSSSWQEQSFTSPPQPKNVYSSHMYQSASVQRSPDIHPGAHLASALQMPQTSLGLQSPTSPLLHLPHSLGLTSPMATPPASSNQSNPFAMLYPDSSSSQPR